MKLLATLAACLLATTAWRMGICPTLEGREIVVVTENAYPPLQFIDGNGNAVGWEYDAMAEIATRLNIDRRLREHQLGCDDPGRVAKASSTWA